MENQGNPTQWIQGMEYAANNGFNLVSLLAGADPRFFEPQVMQTQAKGLKVVTSHLTGLEQDAPAGVDAAVAIDYRKAGETDGQLDHRQDGREDERACPRVQ